MEEAEVVPRRGTRRTQGADGLSTMKFILNGKGGFDAKSPQTWLQSTRDDLAGRTDELDAVLDWAEGQTEQNPAELDRIPGRFPVLQCISSARSCLASCGRDSNNASFFKNVQRHNGLEAWRRIAEPSSED